jgi:AraC-like DNA-binding protein
MTVSCSSTTIAPLHGHVALPYWHALVRAIELVGVKQESIGPVTHAAEIEEGLSTISVARYIALFEVGLKQRSDFGLMVGKSVTPGSYPVLGITLLSCKNLLQVLEQVVRYECLNHDLGKSHIELGPYESIYSWVPNKLVFPNDNSDFCFNLIVSVFAGIVTFAPWLINHTIPLKQIRFTAAEPIDAKAFKDFFGAEILFDQATNSIVVDSNTLDRPVLNGDTTSFNALTTYAESLLNSRDHKQDIIYQLKSILPESLHRQSFRIDDVAKQLNMSSRTLQRKLKAAGHGYKELLDNIRRQLAEAYLADSTLSMNEIAFLVGYQEQSSFNHAFKTWNGIPPSVFRERNRQQS